jgi:hypothetical protein
MTTCPSCVNIISMAEAIQDTKFGGCLLFYTRTLNQYSTETHRDLGGGNDLLLAQASYGISELGLETRRSLSY